MTIIPQTTAQTESFLKKHPDFAVRLSNYTYDRLQSRDPDQPLFQLAALLDFAPLEKACANYHNQSGPGCKPTHPVPKLLRALLVKYFSDYSLREAEFHIRYNLLLKSFVGYAVFDEGPDHTTISRFENYLLLHHPRLFFDTILKQIDAAFPDDHTRSQIADTFAVHANAALESLSKRLRHSCQQLLFAFRQDDPAAYASLWSQLDHEGMFGSADEKIEYSLSHTQRQQRLLTLLNAISACLQTVRTFSLSEAVQRWVSRLEKIIADELRLERDAMGQIIQAALHAKNKRGKYAIFSATDPAATIRNHGPDKKDPGYNASVATTIDFIREIRADTGSQPDHAAIPDLLTAQIEYHDVCPPKLIYDQAAGTGKSVAAVRKATAGQTQLVARPKPTNKKKTETFGPTDFTLSDDLLTLTCPNGRTTSARYRSGSGDGFNFRFSKGMCTGCLLLMVCRGQKQWPHLPAPYAQPTTPRNVFISDYRMEKQALVAYSQTDDFPADMKLRPQVERIIAGLVLHTGARRARFRGLKKVDFQLKMCGAVYNLKRWLALLRNKRLNRFPPKRRRFAAPLPSGGGVGLATA